MAELDQNQTDAGTEATPTPLDTILDTPAVGCTRAGSGGRAWRHRRPPCAAEGPEEGA